MLAAIFPQDTSLLHTPMLEGMLRQFRLQRHQAQESSGLALVRLIQNLDTILMRYAMRLKRCMVQFQTSIAIVGARKVAQQTKN